jgi:hypothetical protein
MGANATTFVPSYTSGEVLTAANLSVTNSGIPVFATTVTRDAAFGGTGEKTLAEGQFAYIEATNTTQYYDGAAWQSVGQTPGLVLVAAQTIGTTVASVTVTGAFSSTYDAYKIVVSGGTSSVTDELLGMTLGATATGYYNAYSGVVYNTGAASLIVNNNATSWTRVGALNSGGIQANFDLVAPNLAKWTTISGTHIFGGSARSFGGYVDNSTQYTAFTLTPGSGTLTGGTIRVYGYANS